MLRLEERWVWDWWLADDGARFHVFYLQAPKALGDPYLRHRNATVGHAVSADLREWYVLPDALMPGPSGAWDDIATWTGSTILHAGIWYLFFTGTSTTEGGRIQRVGLATSPDLVAWAKHPDNPSFEADPRWYEVEDAEAWRETAWRDPWVFADPAGDGFHALITARANDGPPDARGVIGHAWSRDLLHWDVRPPLSAPGEFGQLEVPQVEVVGDTPVLLFSCGIPDIASVRRSRRPDEPTGSFLTVGESLFGPWDIPGARIIPVPDLYSACLVRDRAGEWQVLGFIDGSERGAFLGELSDPFPLHGLGLLW